MDFDRMRLLFSLLAVSANIVVLGFVGLTLAARFGQAPHDLRERLLRAVAGSELWLAFGTVTVATLGSLYLSEIVHLVPCKLCWFQRVFMYPLVPILGMAAWLRDLEIRRYAYPLLATGSAIASYHYLIQRVPSLEGGTCDVFAPCSAAYIWQWGFVSIPYMALSAFALVTILIFSLGQNVRTMSLSTTEGHDEQGASTSGTRASG